MNECKFNSDGEFVSSPYFKHSDLNLNAKNGWLLPCFNNIQSDEIYIDQTDYDTGKAVLCHALALLIKQKPSPNELLNRMVNNEEQKIVRNCETCRAKGNKGKP